MSSHHGDNETRSLSAPPGALDGGDRGGKKHEIVLGQLGHSNIFATLGDPAALAKLEEAFEAFLRTTQAIDVPIDVSVDEIFADYFAHRPPFGIKKKKAEFPDAVVIASLKAWCAKRNAKA